MSNDVVIKVENLSKKYIIGHQQRERYVTFRDTMAEKLKNTGKRLLHPFLSSSGQPLTGLSTTEELWALKDVSFEVKQGERVGIIGPNGAGKTTLLKLLSRITEPTTGRISIKGRVASLLEVGTGFHPELTGRENIFLNGAILGMGKAEIKDKFDEIVTFAEVGKFLDTPVKRYSSGMHVRLAFAVAAHLEAEILLVDEVLAVGDADFQKKCLGKMGDVAKRGRTVLFVSHNMGAVLGLCSGALLLEKGKVLSGGDVSKVVNRYLATGIKQDIVVNLDNAHRPWETRLRATIMNVRLLNNDIVGAWKLPFGSDIKLEIGVRVLEKLPNLELGLALKTAMGFEIASALSSQVLSDRSFTPGDYYFRVAYDGLTLTPGMYRFGLGLRSEKGFEDYLPEAFDIEIITSTIASEKSAHKVLGAIIPEVKIEIVKSSDV